MRSPIGWYGGKARHIKHLLPLIPSHHTYGELFGGGGSLLFAKTPSGNEVFIDAHENLIDFYQLLQSKHTDHPRFKRFMDFISWTPYSRVEYEEYCNYKTEPDPDIRIAKWYLCNRMGFGGREADISTWSLGIVSNVAHTMHNKIKELLQIADRLRDVRIECSDWLPIFNELDRPNSFIYLDPPYLHETRGEGASKIYKHEMGFKEHSSLIDRVKQAKSKVLISGYPSDLYNSLMDETVWAKKEFEVKILLTSHQEEHRDKRVRTEVLWYNYPSPVTPSLPGVG